MKTGVVLANGSDFPVEEPNPMLGFYAAHHAAGSPEGQPPGGWMPEERLSRDEMLKSFTLNAAYAAHAEKDLGSLEVGKLADHGAARQERDDRRAEGDSHDPCGVHDRWRRGRV